jgi:enoyl-CoA hydratase/carnithine racemase
MRFLLTAEEFGAARALRIGLMQEVVPAGAHVQRAADLAHLIAQQAPLGVQATLASARAGLYSVRRGGAFRLSWRNPCV